MVLCPVPSKQGNIYEFDTCPGYGCYFYSSGRRGSVEGDKGKVGGRPSGGQGCTSLRRGVSGKDGGVRQVIEKLIRFGTFNIQKGQNREQGWFDCGVLQETNLTK